MLYTFNPEKMMREKKYQISKRQLIECLSSALELINPTVAGHNQRVALFSKEIAKVMGLSDDAVNEIYYAALLHDIGAAPLTIREKNDLIEFDVNMPYKHCLIGYLLLKDYKPFQKIAEIVHYHHSNWLYGANRTFDGEMIPVGSYIIHLADRVDILIRQNQHILLQNHKITDYIKSRVGSVFAPDAVAALEVLSTQEYFWLGATSKSYCNTCMTAKQSEEYITQGDLEQFTKLVSFVIDFKSRFTASHSCGVSAVARLMGEAFGLSRSDCGELSIAGNLHDLGKLVVPNEVLEKKGALNTEDEAYIKSHSYFTYSVLSQVEEISNIASYAAQHHEKIDGSGYPFHIRDDELSPQSRLLSVADIFTALAEDRPYRKGMHREELMAVMYQMAQSKHLDYDMVKMVDNNFSDFDLKRDSMQQYAVGKYKNFWKNINRTLAGYREEAG